MKNSITLRAVIRATSLYSGTSKFEFWTGIEHGDLISIKTIMTRTNGYTVTLHLENIRTKLKFSGSMTEIKRYLDKLETEDTLTQD